MRVSMLPSTPVSILVPSFMLMLPPSSLTMLPTSLLKLTQCLGPLILEFRVEEIATTDGRDVKAVPPEVATDGTNESVADLLILGRARDVSSWIWNG